MLFEIPPGLCLCAAPISCVSDLSPSGHTPGSAFCSGSSFLFVTGACWGPNLFGGLQAHVKGHIQRVRYQKIRCAMGVLAKAIMRWRSMKRREAGWALEAGEGGRDVDMEEGEEGERGLRNPSHRSMKLDGRVNKMYGRNLSASYAEEAAAATNEALSRMQAMAESEEARAQYSRMRHTHESKMGGSK